MYAGKYNGSDHQSGSSKTRPFQPSIYRVNIWGHFNPTPINRVNNAISNTYRLTYKYHTFLETSGQGLPIAQGLTRLILSPPTHPPPTTHRGVILTPHP